MLSMDEPDHRRLRDIVDEAFRRRAVLEMEQRLGKANRPWKENSTKIRVQFFRRTLGRNERSDDLARSSRPNYGSIGQVYLILLIWQFTATLINLYTIALFIFVCLLVLFGIT